MKTNHQCSNIIHDILLNIQSIICFGFGCYACLKTFQIIVNLI